jgi:hypothetical protein
MQPLTTVRTLCTLLAIPLVACGSSGSGSGAGTDSGADAGVGQDTGAGAVLDAGNVPCDAGIAGDGGRRCSLSMPVQGGLTGTLNGDQGCGDSTGGISASLDWTSSSLGARVSASFTNGLPSQPGTYPLASLNIRSSSAGGGAQSWTAPSGACTITVSMVDIECQGVFGRLMTIVHGTGTCSQPAAPDSGTSAGPVTIADFQFEHWL